MRGRTGISPVAAGPLAALVLALLLPVSASGRDFGDAPDGRPAGYETRPEVGGRFASTSASGGPRHGRGAVLGFRATAERDARQVDGDRGDDGAQVNARSCSRASTLLVEIDARRLGRRLLRNRRTRIYLNGWFDWSRDGDWRDGTDGCAPEWAVHNVAVSPRQLGRDGVALVPIRFRAGRFVDEFWWRVTLTVNERVTRLDGSGPARGYRHGETEDFLQPVSTPLRSRASAGGAAPGARAAAPPSAPRCRAGGSSGYSTSYVPHGSDETMFIELPAGVQPLDWQWRRPDGARNRSDERVRRFGYGLTTDSAVLALRDFDSPLFPKAMSLQLRSSNRHQVAGDPRERIEAELGIGTSTGRVFVRCTFIVFHEPMAEPRTVGRVPPAVDRGLEPPPAPECGDGSDNDFDATADLGGDPGCRDLADDEKGELGSAPECDDAIDNDGDGGTDFLTPFQNLSRLPFGFPDPDCDSAADVERGDSPPPATAAPAEDAPPAPGGGGGPPPPPPGPQCGNGADDDGDGKVDYPADPGCDGTPDDSEGSVPQVFGAAGATSGGNMGLSGNASFHFDEIAFTPLDGTVLDGQPSVIFASCDPFTPPLVRCLTPPPDQNPAHAFGGQFPVDPAAGPGTRMKLSFFDAAGQPITDFVLEIPAP